MSSEIKLGDLVWAKMKGFSTWPSRIVKPGPNVRKNSKKGQRWVYFFGTHDYGWIEETNIKPYAEYKNKFSNGCNSAKFKQGIHEIEDFISKQIENPEFERIEEDSIMEDESDDDKFNMLASSSAPSPKKARKSSDSKRSSDSFRSSVTKKVKHSQSPREENGVSSYLGNELLNLPSVMSAPETPPVDLSNFSDLLKNKNITPSTLTFGFLGVGVIGSGIVKNLINSGHRVNLWSRSSRKCDEIKSQADANKVGQVVTYQAPCDVVQNSDIIFSCLTDPRIAKEIVHGNCGVVHSAADGDGLENKGYVEMTGVDPETSKDICEIIKSKGGRYLEAQVQGSKNEADEGSLVILTAGDQSLFLDCQSCFKAMGKASFFLGDVGYATKVNLILHLMKGIALVGLAEGLALADRCGISSKDLLKIFNLTNLACPFLSSKADQIVTKDFNRVEQAIQHMQKDMKLVLDLSNNLKQPLLMTSTANEVFKHARRLGYDDHDVSCIYMRTRH
ncbi:unnamed protein product [Brassicogethes aeneus]|uniref:Cytokine-like nuclear factor N-PAC n=1 Tax=Brassicogethes aeneus TaxID=1431903 RepID=A0A9P0BCK1_BRAAE|nr:unnamed protein product [Brassicogethes aeneus]